MDGACCREVRNGIPLSPLSFLIPRFAHTLLCLPLLTLCSVKLSSSHYTGRQMSDVIVALAKIGYRPPIEVFDAFVKHIAEHAHELQPDETLALSEALTCIVPGYITVAGGDGGCDGHQEYHDLQMRLRATEVPARVLLRSVPSTSSNGNGTHWHDGNKDKNNGLYVNGNDSQNGTCWVDAATVDMASLALDERPAVHHRHETGGGSNRGSPRANALV